MSADFADQRPAVRSLQDYKNDASREVFRLEYRKDYNVPADLAEFARWKAGEPTAADDPDNEYWQEVRSLRARDVACRRVRVIDFPISDYLRYEINFYEGSIRVGEEILFIERARAIDFMQDTVVTQDFWQFDRSTVLLWKYDSLGCRDGQEEIAGPAADPYRRLTEQLLDGAMPMDAFRERYSESFGMR